MSKRLMKKTIAGGLVITSVITSTTTKANADAAAVVELTKEASMACPYLAPLFITGAAVIVSATTVIGIKQNTKEEENYIYKSYTHLPDEWKPNSWVEKLNPGGKVIQRRYYGSDGKPMVDYDLNDHGQREFHNFKYNGAHKHIYNWNNKRKPRQTGIELSKDEYYKYIKNFNETAEKMKVKYIED